MALASVALATGASAASPNAGCSVGPTSKGTSAIGPWRLLNESALASELAAAGIDPSLAAGEFVKSDKNGDGQLCVMTQVLPNDASGNTTWFVSHDNNARAK